MEQEFGSFSRKVAFVSFLMQLGIVMVHMNTDHYFEPGPGETVTDVLCQWISRLCLDGGTVSLSFFMICSAFLLYYNLTKENMLEKFRRRMVSLLVPFVIWNAAGMIFCALYYWNTEGFTIIFTYIPFQFAMSRYCPVMWFSQALLFFLLFIPVILWVMKKRVIGELVLLGAYLGVRFSKGIISETYNCRAAKAAAVILWIGSFVLPDSFAAYCLSMLRPLYLWVILDKRWITFRLRWWMENNFFIYAIHYFLILAVVPVLSRVYGFWEPTAVFVILWRFVCFFIITLLCELLGRLLMRFAPKAYGICTGGRAPEACYRSRSER